MGKINIQQVLSDFEINPKLVVQVGSHYGQEVKMFYDLGFRDMYLFEPNEAANDVCREKIAMFKDCNIKLVNIAIGNEIGEREMFVENANQGQSSSLLEPKLHLEKFPQIVFNSKETVQIKRLDDYFGENKKISLLYLDCQGFELEVLKGGLETLENVELIYTEVNFVELYKDCVLLPELEEYLFDKGFTLIALEEDQGGFSNALFLKSDIVKDYLEEVIPPAIVDGETVFNEERYLQLNPDVREAVERGDMESGLFHYERFGEKEGREI
ncbi:MAG: FkbM family methyltransferase [Saprospiraceae bacterium]|nr:FkbM family methyltransferase [Saprospiraceae bacterium]